MHSAGRAGTLRRAAADAGIPAVTFEAGEPLRFQAEEIGRGVDRPARPARLDAHGEGRQPRRPHRIYYRSRWLRVNDGGIFLTERKLGDAVQVGDPLGTVTDPVTNERSTVIAPFRGRIIGMAVPQVVIPGFAAFHIGIEQPGAEVEPEPEQEAPAPEHRPDQLDPEEAPE